MKSIDHSYTLDFVIPSGPTGPTGSCNPLDAEIFTTYNDADETKNLLIKNSIILPNNSNIFRISDNYVMIDTMGYYEFTISGYLSESSSFNGASLTLRTSIQNGSKINDLITARLNGTQTKSYFSYTKVGRYGSLQKILLIFNKNQNSDASVHDVRLIIRKMPWVYS